MMNKNSKNLTITLAVLVIGFTFVFFLGGQLEKSRPALPVEYQDEDLSLQGARLKGYALGFEGLMADWYWMQSLQYIGTKILKNPEIKFSIDNLKPLDPRLLYPYLDNATTLDPRFKAPYYYGAVVLPAIDKELAVKIAEKGIAANPDDWRLYQHLGFIYWRLENYEKASESYERGSQITGAPIFFKMMAAQMKSQGGSRQTARTIYRQMYDEAENNQTKELAGLRLLELDYLDERDALRPILQTFKSQNNRCVNNWSELFPLLKSAKPPDGRDFRIDQYNNLVDPGGAPYILDKETCDIRLDPDKTKIPY